MRKNLLLPFLILTSVTNAQISLVKDVNPTGDGVALYPENRIEYNGKLLFAGNDGVNGIELWESDGTETGTILLSNFSSGSNSSSPSSFYLMPTDNRVYFSGSNGGPSTNPNFELCVTDGTASGTLLHREMNQDNVFGDRSSNPMFITSINDNLIFSAKFRWTSANINDGIELCYANTLSNGTTPSPGNGFGYNINSGTASSSPNNYVEFNGDMYFSANNGTDGRELCRTFNTIGTSGSGAGIAVDVNPGPDSSNPEDLFVFNNRLYFTATIPSFGNEIFRITTNGSLTNLRNINPGSGSSNASDFILYNGAILFVADDGTNGRELWSSTGFPSTTNLLSNINPTGSSSPAEFYEFNGSLYFRADDGVNGVELWVTDGTASGTQLLKDINTTGESTPQGFVEYNGKLYFNADDGVNGRELWVTDGTNAGTLLVDDIWLGIASSDPLDLIVAGDDLFFSANNGTTGFELFKYRDPTLSIDDINFESEVKIHPNPTSEGFQLTSNTPIDSVVVYSMQGQEMKRFYGELDYYSISDLSTGIYLVTINSNDECSTKKLLKQ